MGVTKLIQVTNISPAISEEQMLTLFGFVGKIEAMCMYPSLQSLEASSDIPKICYIKFFDATCVGVSQYLTNTVFNDRALVVTPVEDGQIPDEEKAKEMAARVGLPPAVNKPPDKPKSEIVNLLEGTPPNQVIVSHDPHLEKLGLPKYPPLPATYEGPVIEEIRRTVLVIDIEESVTAEELMQFFEKAGDIKYMKFCSRSDNVRYALIEFTEQPHVLEALKMNGQKLKGKMLKLYHSTQAITKPETKSNEVAQREVVEALTRVKEAESLISAAIDPLLSLGKSKKGRSRSKSPRRSHLRRRRSRSRSSHRRRNRSRSRSHRKKSKSPRRHRKSRSKSPQRSQWKSSRSRSPRVRKRSPSKSPRPKRKSRSKTPSRSKRKSRSKSPTRDKNQSRTRSPSKPKRKSRSQSPRVKRKSHSRSPKSKRRSSSKSKTASKSSSSRGFSRSAYRSPERGSKSEVDRKGRERKRDKDGNRDRERETDRDRRDLRHDKRDSDGKHRRSEKNREKDKVKSNTAKGHKSGKENGSYSSQPEGVSGESTQYNNGSIVKENGELQSHRTGVNLEPVDEHNLIGSVEHDNSVLQGPKKMFFSNLHCDAANMSKSEGDFTSTHSEENSDHVGRSQEAKFRSRSQSPCGSMSSQNNSSHSPPDIADCDTRSCSPIRPG